MNRAILMATYPMKAVVEAALPAETRVIGEQWDVELNYVDLLLEGPDFPPTDGDNIPRVTMICYTETDDSGLRTISASWEHQPDKRWLVQIHQG